MQSWEQVAKALSDKQFRVVVLDDGDGPAVIKLNERESDRCVGYWETNYVKPESEDGQSIIASVKARKEGGSTGRLQND